MSKDKKKDKGAAQEAKEDLRSALKYDITLVRDYLSPEQIETLEEFRKGTLHSNK